MSRPQDHFTNTPEDAAEFERSHAEPEDDGPDWQDVYGVSHAHQGADPDEADAPPD